LLSRGKAHLVIESIERGPVLHKEIQLRIRRYIVEQRLQPGDRLPSEETLCAQLGVGRSAVREGLKGLEAIGMIESRRGAGSYVAQFDPGRYIEFFTASTLFDELSIQELTEVRSLLEVAWVVDAVHRLTADDHTDLVAAFQRMRDHAALGQSYRWDDFELHRIIMRHVPNRLIRSMLDALYTLYELHPAPIEAGSNSGLDIQQHEMLVQAVIERNGEAAQKALILSFNKAATNYGFAIGWGDVARHLVGEQQ
jgi:DNA-binding FadR family transcriptional regulator